ncbi:MAG TPA: RDD family protein [Acidimicrobiales bacterium]
MSDLPPPPPPGGFPPPPPPMPGGPPPGYSSTYGGYGTYGAPAVFGEYAGFWSRFAAKLIDGVILGVASILAFAPAFIALAAGPTRLTSCSVDEDDNITIGGTINAICEVPTGGTIAAAVLLGLAGFAAAVVLYVYYFRREGRTGQAWGRKAMDIKLVDANTAQPIGGGRAFGRYLFSSFISGNVLFLGYLWALWDPRHQTWHDKVATSVVVKA